MQKQIATQLIADIVEFIAVINHTYTHRGWKKSIDEVTHFPKVPRDFAGKCEDMLFANNSDMLQKCALDLLANIKAIAFGEICYTEDYKNAFVGLFEEEKSIYNKLFHACNMNDGITAILAGASLQQDIVDIMGLEQYHKQFCDIVGGFNANDLSDYKKLVKTHEKEFYALLSANDVAVCQYKTVEEFEKEMRKTV